MNPTVTGTPTSYSVSPALPTGLTINTTTGQLSGTPTNFGTAAGWGVAQIYTITASNVAGSTTTNISITMRFMRPWDEVQPILDTKAALGTNPGVPNLSGGATLSNFFYGILLKPNGAVYYIAFNAVVTLTNGTVYNAGGKWAGGVLAPNGKIYSFPYNASEILVHDTNLNTYYVIGSLPGSAKWVGGVVALNGKIYGIPHNSDTVLVIDPTNDTVSTIGSLTTASGKWSGGVLAPNGKIYGIPYQSTTVL